MYEHGEQEVSDEEFLENILAGSDPEAFVERLRELEQLGGTVITLQNNSGAHAEQAIEVLGSQVLPALRGARV
jgi:hemolysin-activating ACP:hemolysin acyltransferase